MSESAQEKERGAHVVALAPGHDPTRLRLSAAEGYLLSRIDGRTPWRLLREIGGIPAQAVDDCLERWLSEGLIEVVGAGATGFASGEPVVPTAGAALAEASILAWGTGLSGRVGIRGWSEAGLRSANAVEMVRVPPRRKRIVRRWHARPSCCTGSATSTSPAPHSGRAACITLSPFDQSRVAMDRSRGALAHLSAMPDGNPPPAWSMH